MFSASSDELADTTSQPGLTADAITEALLRSPDAVGRADILCALVAEVCAAVRWLSPTNDPEEIDHATDVLEAACKHQQRMRLRVVGQGRVRPRAADTDRLRRTNSEAQGFDAAAQRPSLINERNHS